VSYVDWGYTHDTKFGVGLFSVSYVDWGYTHDTDFVSWAVRNRRARC
jgi:hypothetical protein